MGVINQGQAVIIIGFLLILESNHILRSNMALTNYRVYKWLIFLLADTDQEEGMSKVEINNAYFRDLDEIYNTSIDSGMAATRRALENKEDNTPRKANYDKEQFRYIENSTFYNWRAAIWKNFGLSIQHPVVKGIAKNTYILENKDELDKQKTLREIITFLAEDEQRAYTEKNPFKSKRAGRPKKVQPVSVDAMGFVSSGSSNVNYINPQLGYQYSEEPEMVGIIQFAMTIGEALVMNYSKVMTKEEKAHWNYTPEELFVLEPQQLLHINGRWYVAGDLYQYSNREKRRTVIYDVEKIKLYEGKEDLDVPSYKLQEGFDIYNFLPSDWNQYFNPDKVVSLYLRVAGAFLDANPFCEAQEKIEDYKSVLYNLYKVFLKPDENFFIQYMAYGDELQLFHPYDKNEIPPLVISEEQYHYLNDLRKRGF